jgi:hypothetical protein
MTIRLVGSTSGYTEIDAPAVAGSNTLVLPTGNGSSGQVLSTNGSGALSWIGAGKILQVVNAFYSSAASNSTSTYADTGLSATITPTSSSSKILVLVDQAGCGKENGNTGSKLQLKLMRGSTDICTFESSAAFTLTDVRNYIGACSTSFLDSPATASSVTYKTQFRNGVNAASVLVQAGGETSTITLLEVAA